MKCLSLAVFFLLIIPLSSSAAENDNFTQIGVSIGSTNIFGVYVERHFGETSIRAQIGYLIHAVGFSIMCLRHFGSSKNRPYVGIGFLKYVEDKGLNKYNLLCVPAGVDIYLSKKNNLGVELVPAFALSVFRPDGGKKKNIYDHILPLPNILYKYRM